MFIKTRTKYASKDGIELAVFEAFGVVLVEALSFGLEVVELVFVRGLAVLLVNGLSFVHTVVYDTYKQTHNQEKRNKSFTVELGSELRYGDRSDIFGWFLNGTAQNYISNGVVKFQADQSSVGA